MTRWTKFNFHNFNTKKSELSWEKNSLATFHEMGDSHSFLAGYARRFYKSSPWTNDTAQLNKLSQILHLWLKILRELKKKLAGALD